MTSLAASRLYPLAPSFADDDLTALPALELARRLRRRELGSVELLDHYLARIQRLNPRVNAFVEVYADMARRQAARADRRRGRAADNLPPFWGVPTAVKDHHMMRFTRTQLGSRSFRWLWSPVDDRTVGRLRAAGFLLLGKTSMSELGLLPIVETELHPPTRNPWDLTRTAGGSSGGAGAALAAGLLPIAAGSDGAGSVRIPAALNGLVGLKPTRGLVPDDAPQVNVFGLATVGPMARSLGDAAALLDVLAARPVGTTAQRASRDVGSLRVGLMTETPFGDIDTRIIALVQDVAAALARRGHRVTERATPRVALDAFTPLYQRFLSKVPVLRPQQLQPTVRWFWEEGKKVDDTTAWERFHYFQRLGAEGMEGCDVVLSPTVGVVPPRVGQFATLAPPEVFAASAILGAFTALCNVTGQPALTIPIGEVEGVPVGLQIVGRHGEDELLFALAAQVEALSAR